MSESTITISVITLMDAVHKRLLRFSRLNGFFFNSSERVHEVTHACLSGMRFRYSESNQIFPKLLSAGRQTATRPLTACSDHRSSGIGPT